MTSQPTRDCGRQLDAIRLCQRLRRRVSIAWSADKTRYSKAESSSPNYGEILASTRLHLISASSPPGPSSGGTGRGEAGVCIGLAQHHLTILNALRKANAWLIAEPGDPDRRRAAAIATLGDVTVFCTMARSVSPQSGRAVWSLHLTEAASSEGGVSGVRWCSRGLKIERVALLTKLGLTGNHQARSTIRTVECSPEQPSEHNVACEAGAQG